MSMESIYWRHANAMYALSLGSPNIDVNAARMALWLGLDELAQQPPIAVPLPPAGLQDAELQLLQINDWLAENAPEHYCQPGNTAETVITVLDAMDNTIALNAAAFGKLSASYDQLAERLHASDTDVADLVERTERMTNKLADVEAALEEARSHPYTLNVVAATELPVTIKPNGNGNEYVGLTTAQIVAALAGDAVIAPSDDAKKSTGYRFKGTNAELLEEVETVLKNLAKTSGATPSKTYYNNVCGKYDLPTGDGVMQRLGLKWSEIVAHAGLEPKKSFSQQKEEAGESRAATFPAA
jgi:hypothetical protein